MDKKPKKDLENERSRKWQLTINNPQDKGIDHDAIKLALGQFKSCEYWCMGDEIGLEENTPHTHVFFKLKNAVQFSTIKKRFPTAHIENAYGGILDNRAYVEKSGKWADDPKADTSVSGTFEESGPPPDEPGQGARTDIAAVYDQIQDGIKDCQSGWNFML